MQAGVCRHCAGVLARIALASSPALRCHHHCRRCASIVALVALIMRPSRWHSPFRHHRCTWRPCRIRRHRRPSSVFCSLTPLRQCKHLFATTLSLERLTAAAAVLVMATWPSMLWPRQRWRFLWRCAGILTRIALASLPASSCPCRRRCALPCHARALGLGLDPWSWRPFLSSAIFPLGRKPESCPWRSWDSPRSIRLC